MQRLRGTIWRGGAAASLLAALAGCAMPPRLSPAAALPSLSGSVQARRFASVQKALERHPSASPLIWSAPRAGVSGSVVPIETVHSKIYGWCRDYEERIATPARNYRLVGIACRRPHDGWLVLDMRPFVEGRG